MAIWLPAESVLTRDGKNPRLLGVNPKLEVRSPLSYWRTFAIDVLLVQAGVDNVGLLFRQKANGVCITVKMLLIQGAVCGGRRELWMNPLMKLVDAPKQCLRRTLLWSNCQSG